MATHEQFQALLNRAPTPKINPVAAVALNPSSRRPRPRSARRHAAPAHLRTRARRRGSRSCPRTCAARRSRRARGPRARARGVARAGRVRRVAAGRGSTRSRARAPGRVAARGRVVVDDLGASWSSAAMASLAARAGSDRRDPMGVARAREADEWIAQIDDDAAGGRRVIARRACDDAVAFFDEALRPPTPTPRAGPRSTRAQALGARREEEPRARGRRPARARDAFAEALRVGPGDVRAARALPTRSSARTPRRPPRRRAAAARGGRRGRRARPRGERPRPPTRARTRACARARRSRRGGRARRAATCSSPTRSTPRARRARARPRSRARSPRGSSRARAARRRQGRGQGDARERAAEVATVVAEEERSSTPRRPRACARSRRPRAPRARAARPSARRLAAAHRARRAERIVRERRPRAVRGARGDRAATKAEGVERKAAERLAVLVKLEFDKAEAAGKRAERAAQRRARARARASADAPAGAPMGLGRRADRRARRGAGATTRIASATRRTEVPPPDASAAANRGPRPNRCRRPNRKRRPACRRSSRRRRRHADDAVRGGAAREAADRAESEVRDREAELAALGEAFQRRRAPEDDAGRRRRVARDDAAVGARAPDTPLSPDMVGVVACARRCRSSARRSPLAASPPAAVLRRRGSRGRATAARTRPTRRPRAPRRARSPSPRSPATPRSPTPRPRSRARRRAPTARAANADGRPVWLAPARVRARRRSCARMRSEVDAGKHDEAVKVKSRLRGGDEIRRRAALGAARRRPRRASRRNCAPCSAPTTARRARGRARRRAGDGEAARAYAERADDLERRAGRIARGRRPRDDEDGPPPPSAVARQLVAVFGARSVLDEETAYGSAPLSVHHQRGEEAWDQGENRRPRVRPLGVDDETLKANATRKRPMMKGDGARNRAQKYFWRAC